MSPSGLEEGVTGHHPTATESYFQEDTGLASGSKEERTEPRAHGITTSNPSSTSSNTIPTHPTLKLVCLAALVIFSTLTAQTTAPAVLQNRIAVLGLLPVHFLLLALSIFVTSRIKPRGSFHLRGLGGQEGERSDMRILAALSVMVGLGGLWEGRLLDGKIWEAVEIYIIPTLIFLPNLSSYIPFLPSTSVSNPTQSLSYLSLVFLIGFSLIGVPAAGGVLLVPLGRTVVEAVRWGVLKGVTGREGGGGILLGSTLWAFVLSSIILALSALFASESFEITLPAIRYLALYSLFSLASQVLLIITLHLFTSPLTAAFTLLPRNLLLLIIESKVGRNKLGLVGNWWQVVCVLGGGTVLGMLVDEELRELVWVPQRWRGLIANGRNYEALPTIAANGSTLSNDSPSSPTLSNSSTAGAKVRLSPYLALIPFLPLLVHSLHSSSSLSSACSSTYLPSTLHSKLCTFSGPPPVSTSVDLVFAYFDEPLNKFREHLDKIREGEFVKKRHSRVIVYNKGFKTERELRGRIGLKKWDEVITLENVGREGATYLQHILLHYNSSLPTDSPFISRSSLLERSLADHTFFLQPHLAWGDIAQPRIDLVEADTGFAHFGPMMRSDCGMDGRGNGPYPIVKEIFNIFVGEICPPTGQLTAWSAQFVVSKRRILANAYEKYRALDEILEAPEGHWIHQIWGPNGSGNPGNPAAGHAVERGWPMIFGCRDPIMADQCPDEVHEKEKCQCLDS